MLDFLMVNDHYLPSLCFIPFDPFSETAVAYP